MPEVEYLDAIMGMIVFGLLGYIIYLLIKWGSIMTSWGNDDEWQ
jgi:hypothetical protein